MSEAEEGLGMNAMGRIWWQVIVADGMDGKAKEPEELWTVKEVAKYLKWHVKKVYEEVEKKRLPCIRIGKRAIRFLPSDITRWLTSRKE